MNINFKDFALFKAILILREYLGSTSCLCKIEKQVRKKIREDFKLFVLKYNSVL